MMKCQMSLAVAAFVSVIAASETFAGNSYKAGAEKIQSTVSGRGDERGALSRANQGFGFIEKVGAVMDPALSDPYAPRAVKEAAAQRLSDSYRNIQDKQSAIDAALKRSSEPLKMPKCGLVSAADIRNYPLVEKYLTLDDPEISHYFILHEDYVFEGLDGRQNVVPAGFIWDGASIPKDFRISIPIVEREIKIPNVQLETGNTRYSSAISEGLIHDWMYRNPMKYSKEDADLLFYVNAVRCKNSDPLKLYEAVNVFGADSYNGHVENVRKGFYAGFTDEFYNKNTTIYQSCLISRKPEVFDRDPECKKDASFEEKVCRDDKPTSVDEPASGGKTETVDVVDAGKVDSSGEVGIRGWCSCREKQETSGAKSIMVGCPWESLADPTVPMPRYSYYFCLRCGKCRRPDLKWDSRVIFDNQLEMRLSTAKGLRTSDYVNARKDVERKFMNIPDGQIVFPGKCTCKDPDPIRDGFMNNYVCVRCGRCYVPVNNTVPIGPTARAQW